MKLHTKIISLLLVAGLASAGAQSAGSSASNFYLKGSVGSAGLESDGSLTKLFTGVAGASGLDLKMDSRELAFSFEGGMYYGENISFGLEWTMLNSDAKSSKTLQSGDIASLNTALGLSGGGALTAAAANFEEKIDMDRFMFVFNYEYYFSDQLSLLVNTGLGIINVEQEIKVTQGTSQRINSKSDESAFAYQLGLSLGYHFNESLSFYGGGRYLAASDVDFQHGALKLKGFNPDALVYEVGVRYSF